MKINLIYTLLLIISKLSLTTLYVVSTFFYLLNSITIKYRLKVITRNIQYSYPELNKKKQIKLIDKFYKSFFKIMFEIIKSISFQKSDILEKVKITNTSLITYSINKKKPIVLIGSHYANWEWGFLRISLIENINLNAVYKPLKNRMLNQILLKIRCKFGADLIPLNKWKYFILKNKNMPKTFMFLADQVPNNKKNGTRIDFLNQSTLFYEGAEKTSNLLNADVFYIECLKTESGCYKLNFEKIESQNITKKYVNLLQKTINKKPEHWLWSHNRWKR